MDQDTLCSALTVQALRQSGLLKFFCTSPMRVNVRLLEHLIGYWDHDLGDFDLQGEILEVALKAIYFIMGLSRQGTLVNLKGTSRGGDPMSVRDYINTYCMPRS